jgi:Uncharacterized protein conserved in bacteria
MPAQTTTHLNFRGDARHALEFYQSVSGGHLVVNTYADFGMPAEIPSSDRVVLGLVAAENGFRIMGYDIPGRAEGGIAGGGSTHRENNATVTDQALFVSTAPPPSRSSRARRCRRSPIGSGWTFRASERSAWVSNPRYRHHVQHTAPSLTCPKPLTWQS